RGETWNGYFATGRRWTAIDHVVQLNGARTGKTKVIRRHTELDHWPVRLPVTLEGGGIQEPPMISRWAVRKTAREIAADSSWDGTDSTVEAFQKTCGEVLRARSCFSKTPKEKKL
ncbi:MAG: uncharacterized protein A8A55_3653, partial [Amphiamblys sp. WSBS2006]